jgi:hypothetical protein
MECGVFVEKVSVNVNALERKCVGGVDREAVTIGVRGCALRVSKITVSLLCGAAHGIACVDDVGMPDAASA